MVDWITVRGTVCGAPARGGSGGRGVDLCSAAAASGRRAGLAPSSDGARRALPLGGTVSRSAGPEPKKLWASAGTLDETE